MGEARRRKQVGNNESNQNYQRRKRVKKSDLSYMLPDGWIGSFFSAMAISTLYKRKGN